MPSSIVDGVSLQIAALRRQLQHEPDSLRDEADEPDQPVDDEAVDREEDPPERRSGSTMRGLVDLVDPVFVLRARA